jgi:DNA-binding PadR family transcriptional regulator
VEKGGTMYELIILSLLMHQPLHGYLIAKITNDMIGPWAKISNGTLYPLLTRLEKAGLIITSPEGSEQQRGDRQLRTFMITEVGRKRFHQLMIDTSTNPGEYQKFFQMKVSHIEFLQPEERLFLFDHYINYCQTQILYMKSEAKDMIDDTTNQRYPMSPRRLELTLDMMQHFVEQWQAELDWVRRLRKQEIARIEAGPHNNTRGKEEKSRELI